MVINTGKGSRYKYYKCKSRIVQSTKACSIRQIRKETLEAMILDALKSRVFTFEAVEALISDVKAAVQEKYADIRSQVLSKQAKRASIEKEYDILIEVIKTGQLDDTKRIKSVAESLDKQLDNIEEEIAELKTSTSLPLRKFGNKQISGFVEATLKVLLQSEHDACKSLLVDAVGTISVKSMKLPLKAANFRLWLWYPDTKMGTLDSECPLTYQIGGE